MQLRAFPLRKKATGLADLHKSMRVKSLFTKSSRQDRPEPWGSNAPPLAPTDTPLEEARVLDSGDVLNARFTISTFLGRGGMGEVYAAEDGLLETIIALKVIRMGLADHSEIRTRLIREVKIARMVTHPNVCRIYDIQECSLNGTSLLFLTMELLHGETLAERLGRPPRLESAESGILARHLCEALATLHRSGVTHRDFKPANVMLTPSEQGPRAVIMDFGLARPAPGWSKEETITETGRFLGTPGYMAPEQACGNSICPGSDVYAMGLVVAQMITGLDLTSLTATRESGPALSEHARVLLQHAGHGWIEWIQRCTEFDPANRFSSAVEASHALPWRQPFVIHSRTGRALRAAVALAGGIACLAAVASLIPRISQKALPAEQRIAILPFRQIAGQPLDADVLTGLGEMLYRDLRECCTARTTYFFPPTDAKPLGTEAATKASRSLGVNLIFSGYISEDHGRITVTGEIADALSHQIFRSIRLKTDSDGLLQLGDALAAKTAAALGLTPLGRSSSPRQSVLGRALLYRQRAAAHLEGQELQCPIALPLLQQAAEADKTYAPAHIDLARTLIACYHSPQDLSFLGRAEEALTVARAQQGDTASILLLRANLQQLRGNWQQAIETLSQSRSSGLETVELLRALALASRDAGNSKAAEADFRRAVEMRPNDWRLQSSLGQFLLSQARYAEAADSYREAYRLAPDNLYVAGSLGGVLLYQEKFTEARELLEHAASIRASWKDYSPQDWSLFSNLGWALFHDGQLARAEAAFDQATLLAPNDHRAWRNRGDCYQRLEIKGEAKASYQKALDLVGQRAAANPADHSLDVFRSLYLSKCGRCDEASREARRLGRSSKDPQVLENSAIVLELCHARRAAAETLRAAFQSGLSWREALSTYEFQNLLRDFHFPGAQQ